jgi:hypothetical protein
MQETETLLSITQQRGARGLPLTRQYFRTDRGSLTSTILNLSEEFGPVSVKPAVRAFGSASHPQAE